MKGIHAPWRVYKSPPGWRLADSEKPWLVMRRVYTEDLAREWVNFGNFATWEEAIESLLIAERGIRNDDLEDPVPDSAFSVS